MRGFYLRVGFARITSPVWVLRHLSGKAAHTLLWKGPATPPDWMDRRPNRDFLRELLENQLGVEDSTPSDGWKMR